MPSIMSSFVRCCACIELPQATKRTPADVSSSYLDIDHVAAEGGLELLVKITTKSGSSGYLYLDPSAKVKRIENPS